MCAGEQKKGRGRGCATRVLAIVGRSGWVTVNGSVAWGWAVAGQDQGCVVCVVQLFWFLKTN